MKNFERLTKKPEYYCNPRQLYRRLLSKRHSNQATVQIDLLWQHKKFLCNPKETIGKSLAHFGLYDLTLSECLYRLLEPKALCLDIGANIGYFSSLMSHFAQPVHAFEPHPRILQTLKHNCEKLPNLTIHPVALSDKPGEAILYVPQGFEKNEGTSSLFHEDSSSMEHSQHPVQTMTLDSLFPTETIDLLKIDVEKHEYAVFKGASTALSEGRIGCIFFEDFEGSSSPVVQLLRDFGYQVHRLTKGYSGPQLLSVEDGDKIPLWEPPNFIATRKDISSLQKTGWTLYKNSKRRI